MSRKLKLIAPPLIVFALLALNVGVFTASAHNWGNWHWDKSGTNITIQQWTYGTNTAEAENARQDAWNRISNLYNYNSRSHTDISVFGDNAGNTGWAGLASLENVSGDHIIHAHARYNNYYGYASNDIQGVYCQEVEHTYGFDHNNTGGCMGAGYFSGSGNTLSQHDVDDFYNLYRYH